MKRCREAHKYPYQLSFNSSLMSKTSITEIEMLMINDNGNIKGSFEVLDNT